MVEIQNIPVVAGYADVSSKVIDGSSVCIMGVLVELGDLVSHIQDVASRTIIKEIEISDNGKFVEPMVKGRQ